ncbi:hypothetical protein FACS1894170_00150 [Planctomycetales bacterium]|nr:hypothetical protein FACS1894170_00150 [Planctomycetales bacterium]
MRMHATLGKEFQTYAGKRAVQLRPATWKGKEFPLAPYLDPVPMPDFLKHGEHLVVLIKTDCERCHRLLDELQASGTQNVIVIEVPQLHNQPIMQVSFPHYYKLNNYAAEWHVDTPCVIRIADNVCVEVEEPHTIDLAWTALNIMPTSVIEIDGRYIEAISVATQMHRTGTKKATWNPETMTTDLEAVSAHFQPGVPRRLVFFGVIVDFAVSFAVSTTDGIAIERLER